MSVAAPKEKEGNAMINRDNFLYLQTKGENTSPIEKENSRRIVKKKDERYRPLKEEKSLGKQRKEEKKKSSIEGMAQTSKKKKQPDVCVRTRNPYRGEGEKGGIEKKGIVCLQGNIFHIAGARRPPPMEKKE